MRVEKHIFRDNNKEMHNVCACSKNLYNQANYLVLEELKRVTEDKKKKWLRYQNLNKLLKNHLDYRSLPAQTAQQTLRLVDKNWSSFFRAIKDFKKHPEKYTGMPRPPDFKDHRNIVVFTKQQAKIKNGYIHFPKRTGLQPIKTKIKREDLREVRIVPQTSCFVVEVVYKKEERHVPLNKLSWVAGDIGLNNLLTVVHDTGRGPFVINGRPLKSINQYYNKVKVELKSIAKKCNDKNSTKRLRALELKRKCKIEDYMHKASRFLINYLIEHQIGNIAIGHNKGWKQEIDLGKKTNQNFVSVPFNRFIEMIRYKAEEVGINVVVTEEAYTSKASFLDNDPLFKYGDKPKGHEFSGRRMKRDRYVSKDGTWVHADVNGGYNIGRKVAPEAFSFMGRGKGVEGTGLYPVQRFSF